MVLYFALVCCARAPRALTACGKGERIATRLAAVSPTGTAGASASQRCPPDTRTAMTGYCNFFADVIYRHILYFYIVKVSKGKFVPLVIREGPETQLKGCPAVLSPISVRTEIGRPRGTSANGLKKLKSL